MSKTEDFHAEVISVFPGKVRISVDDLISFRLAEDALRVGSFLKISDNDNVSLICIIESFSIEIKESTGDARRVYIIDAYPLGTLSGGRFQRGGDELAIPPKRVVPASRNEIAAIYADAVAVGQRCCFTSLSRQREIQVPVHGDKFFNKHVAVVGATGAGKSSSIASILQTVTTAKSHEYQGLNNSHIVIFDIHSEYQSAFPKANVLTVDNIVLPYWLLNDTEMEDMFLESGDHNNYNQESLLRTIVTQAKELGTPEKEKIHFDSPLRYDIEHIYNCLINLSSETKDAKNSLLINRKSGDALSFDDEREKIFHYCKELVDFAPTVHSKINKGTYADGSIDKFVKRICAKIRNPRLSFMFGEEAKRISLQEVMRQITGYHRDRGANITIIDLSGIPFEVLSITVSLVTRLLFDFAYFSRRRSRNCDAPFLVVYEEAHKYAPRSELARFKASLNSIERIAKEGRKYGVSLLISSQRPSEISETIFSQCSNFLAMRLTNPNDQAYVKRLLPDTLGNLTSALPSLEQGEALIIGDAVVMPSLVYVDPCSPKPSSSDIPYYAIWKAPWHEIDFDSAIEEWLD